MVKVLDNTEAAKKVAELHERLVNACAVWTALHDTGAPSPDTRWRWAEGEIMRVSRDLHALKIVMWAEDKGGKS